VLHQVLGTTYEVQSTKYQYKAPNRQDPATQSSKKILHYCHVNGQGPALSPFCNIFIMQKQKFKPYEEPSFMHCEQRANYILDCHLRLPNTALLTRNASVERRSKPRSNDVLPARVWGVDIEDQPFCYDCQLDNISASGLFLRLPRRMKFSSSISLVVRLLTGPDEGMVAAIKGTVMREESNSDGHRGIGIRITEHKFI